MAQQGKQTWYGAKVLHEHTKNESRVCLRNEDSSQQVFAMFILKCCAAEIPVSLGNLGKPPDLFSVATGTALNPFDECRVHNPRAVISMQIDH